MWKLSSCFSCLAYAVNVLLAYNKQCHRKSLQAPRGRVEKLVDPLHSKINFINLLTIGQISVIFMTYTLVHYHVFVVMKITEICPIVKRLMKLISHRMNFRNEQNSKAILSLNQ